MIRHFRFQPGVRCIGDGSGRIASTSLHDAQNDHSGEPPPATPSDRRVYVYVRVCLWDDSLSTVPRNARIVGDVKEPNLMARSELNLRVKVTFH